MKQSHIETRIERLEQTLRPAQNEVEVHVTGARRASDGTLVDDDERAPIILRIPGSPRKPGVGKITKPGT